MKRMLSLIGAIALTAMLVVPVAAHTQTVIPASGDEPVVSGPISKAWAQAHCQANAMYVVYDASNGVVAFNPPVALICSSANPGGQVTGP
jgi:hypothetical protein